MTFLTYTARLAKVTSRPCILMPLFLRATCNPTPGTPELQATFYRRSVPRAHSF